MKRQLILHAGFYKTGTTSVQALIPANRSRLPDGTVYLGGDLGDFDDLLKAMRGFVKRSGDDAGKRVRDAAANLLARPDVAQASCVVLSSELMTGPIPKVDDKKPAFDGATALLGWVVAGASDRDVTVVLYTRNEASWLRSLFRHMVVSRGIRVSEEQFVRLDNLRGFSWAPVIERIRATLDCRVVEFRMEDDLETRLGPGTQMLRLLGVSDEELQGWRTIAPQNQGVHPEAIRIMSRPAMLALPAKVRQLLLKLVKNVISEPEGPRKGARS